MGDTQFRLEKNRSCCVGWKMSIIYYDPPKDIDPTEKITSYQQHNGTIMIMWESGMPVYFYDPIKNIVGLFTHPTHKPANSDEIVCKYIEENYGKKPTLVPFNIV